MTKVNPDDAAALMLTKDLVPQEPYPGSIKPWHCVHTPCGNHVYPMYNHVRRGASSGCKFCGSRANGDNKFLDPEETVKFMRSVGLEPQTPYPGAAAPWPSVHLICGEKVTPRYTNVRSGNIGCTKCRREKAAKTHSLDPIEAEKTLLEAGYRPTTNYPGAKNPWPSVHIECGTAVSPRLHSIKSGQGGCTSCARWAFKRSDPATLYVIENIPLNATKIGVSGDTARTNRIKALQKAGWSLVHTINFPVGSEAVAREKYVLDAFDGYRGFLTASDMGNLGGWSETFCRTEVPASNLVTLLEAG